MASILFLGVLGNVENVMAGNGIPAGSDGGNPDGVDPFGVQPVFEGSVFFPLTEVNACQPVSSCPPILKQMDNEADGGPLFPPTSSFSISEHWIIGSNGPSWADWHEKILTTPWIFTSVSISDCASPLVDVSNTIMSGGTEVWIKFDPPLVPGDELCINKRVEDQTQQFRGIVQVIEWPTIRTAVGGDMIQMETTSILAAGAQYTAAWMIPVIVSGIGFAIVIARKF